MMLEKRRNGVLSAGTTHRICDASFGQIQPTSSDTIRDLAKINKFSSRVDLVKATGLSCESVYSDREYFGNIFPWG